MINQLLQFEWRYHTRQISFVVAILVFGAMGFAINGRVGGMETSVNINSPYSIAHSLGLLSLGATFILTVFGNNAVLRDSAFKMSELVYATPVHKFDLLFARFLGLLIAAFLAFSAAPVGMLANTMIPMAAKRSIGPIDVGSYFWVLLVLILPTMFFIASVLFAVATLTRNAVATYAAGISIYAGYFLSATFVGSPMMANTVPASPEVQAWASLLDPFGLSAFFEQVKHWTASERNTQAILLSGAFLWNRLLVIAGASCILTGVCLRFRPKVVSDSSSRRNKKDRDVGKTNERRYVPVTPIGQAAPVWNAYLHLTRLEIRSLFKSLPFVAILVIWAFVVGGEMLAISYHTPFSSPVFPTTAALLGRIQFDVLPIWGILVLVFYSGELVWRERSLHVHPIVDSYPTGTIAFFSAKLSALVLIPTIMIAVCITVGLGVQLAYGYHQFQPLLYLSLFYYGGVPLLLAAVLALLFQTLSPNKYLGMFLCGLFLLLDSPLMAGITGIEHPMLHFSRSPRLRYSDMSGYGLGGHAFNWYMLYWGSFASLLSIASYGFWPRGEGRSFRSRSRAAVGQVGRAGLLLAALALLVLVGSGGYIYYQTNIASDYASRSARLDWQAEYETQFKRYQGMDQPTVVAVKTEMAIFPEERRYRVKGEYTLANRTSRPIQKLLISLATDVVQHALTVDGADLVEYEVEFGQSRFKFEQALLPGRTTILRFDVEQRQSGFANVSALKTVLGNGTFLMNFTDMPVIGYVPNYELRNGRERRDRGLPARPGMEHLEFAVEKTEGARRHSFDWVAFETLLSTTATQTALAPGALMEEWQEGGRNYFKYVAASPLMIHQICYLSARYHVHRSEHNGTCTAIYYHPKHGVNVPVMEQALKDSLEYCSKHFGAYPNQELRLAEAPAYTSMTGYTVPYTIFLGETGAFNYDTHGADSLVDQVYRTTVHEVAHQWWGHQVYPADISKYEGGMALVETLARYSELMMLENAFGKSAVLRWVDYERERYMTGRADERNEEVPLYRVTSQQYLMYSKGSVVMYALKELLGEEAINRALRTLLQEHAHPKEPATSLDLVEALHKVAPADQRRWIDEWFKEIVLYDVGMGSSSCKRLADGRYQVDISVRAKKHRADGVGEEVPLEFNQDVDIAIFAAGSGDKFSAGPQGRLLHLQPHHASGQEAFFSITLDKKPSRVEIDPFNKMIERNRADNFVELSQG